MFLNTRGSTTPEVDTINDFSSEDSIWLKDGVKITNTNSTANVGGDASVADTVLTLSTGAKVQLLDFHDTVAVITSWSSQGLLI